MTKFTESQKQWMENYFSSMKIGANWITSFAVYRKTDSNRLSLLIVNKDNRGWDLAVTMTKDMCEEVGIEYHVSDDDSWKEDEVLMAWISSSWKTGAIPKVSEGMPPIVVRRTKRSRKDGI